MESPLPRQPALLVCACGFVFRFDFPGREAWRHGRHCVEADTRATVDGVLSHELPLLHRALGGCPRMARIVLVKAQKTNKPCDKRCFQARGEACDCSCAGARHGLAHRAL